MNVPCSADIGAQFDRGAFKTSGFGLLNRFLRSSVLTCTSFLGWRKVSSPREHVDRRDVAQRLVVAVIVEQDHFAVKRVTRPMLGFKSFDAARSTLAGIELI